MSVLACDREGCRNIMCDHCILESSRYVCGECWSELMEYRQTWPEEMKESAVRERLVEFMNSPKGSERTLRSGEIEREFRRLTGYREE